MKRKGFMGLTIAPDSQGHIFELAVLSAVSAGLTVLATNIAGLNLGMWAPAATAALTIILSIIKNIESA